MYLHYTTLAIIRLFTLIIIGAVSVVLGLFVGPSYLKFYVSRAGSDMLAVSLFKGPPGLTAYIGEYGVLGRLKISLWIYQVRVVAWFAEMTKFIYAYGMSAPVPVLLTKQEGEIFAFSGKVGRCFQIWETDEEDSFHTEPVARFFRYALVKPWSSKYAWNIQLGWPMIGGRYDGGIAFKINPFHRVK